MRIFYLDNEHQSFVVTAVDQLEAWRKLRSKHDVWHPELGHDRSAYRHLDEVDDGDRIETTSPITFVF